MIGGLDQPDSGEVLVGGEDLCDMTSVELASWRADNVGFVFQGFNLLSVLSAVENVELPLQLTNALARRNAARRPSVLSNLSGCRTA